MKTIKIIIFLLWGIVSFSNAQIKVDSNGKTMIGPCPYTGINPYNNSNYGTLQLYGTNYASTASPSISFGNFSTDHGHPYVFIKRYLNQDKFHFYGNDGFIFQSHRGIFADYPGEGTFYFDVNLQATGFYTYSDERFKTNVQNIESPLSKLSKLKGVSYNMLDIRSLKQAKNNLREEAFVNNTEDIIAEDALKTKEDYKKVEELNNRDSRRKTYRISRTRFEKYLS